MNDIDPWNKELHGFGSLSEFVRFTEWIDSQVISEIPQEIARDANYSKGEIHGGRWFKHLASGEMWRLVETDYPFRGLWECIVPPLASTASAKAFNTLRKN